MRTSNNKFTDGWLEGLVHRPSPNCSARPNGTSVSLLVIHNISLPPGEFGNGYIEDFFLNQLATERHPYFETLTDLRVSAHFLIKRTGEIVQFVSCNNSAWHAGVSAFEGLDKCNDYSIGIELEGTDDLAYENKQYDALSALSQRIIEAYQEVSTDRIVGHCDISPGRKTDPGDSFDWSAFRDSLI